MRVIAISTRGEDTLEFRSLHEAAKWAGLNGAVEVKKLIDSGEEYRGVFFDWADKSFSISEKEKSHRTRIGRDFQKKEKKATKWKDPEFKKQWQHEWYLAHREEMRTYMRKYTQEHKENIKAYKAENAEKLKEQKRAWREKNVERIREYNREYYAKRQAAEGEND